MKRMFTIFMIWRSLPAILIYLSLPGNIKNQIDKLEKQKKELENQIKLLTNSQ